MGKELEGLEEGPKAKIHLNIHKKYQIVRYQAMTTYMDTGLKTSLPSMTDWLLRWTDADKKTDIPESMTKGKTTLIQKYPQKRTTPTTTDP